MNNAPTIASIDDICPAFAARAFSGTSFTPEKRGDARRQEYADQVNGLYAVLWSFAAADEQKTLLAEEMERYKDGYRSRMNAYLASHANVVSSMIAGPARFPVARMQKRSQWADNKANELHAWSEKARKTIKAKLLDARPQEQKEAAEWQGLAHKIQADLNTIAAIDAGSLPYTRSAFVTSLTGKVQRLARNGESALVDKALEMVQAFDAGRKKPAISLRHKFWTLGEVANQKAAKASEIAASAPGIIAQAEGVEIIANAQADRVQIVFGQKPDAAMIVSLKKEGWKWSPSQGVWQRKLTEAAKFSAKRLVGTTA